MGQVILVVDDNRDILRFLHSTLDSLKNPELTIFEAPSGEEALLESARRKIDLLITDYKLPGITGVELMHKIRSRHQDARTVLVSGVTERKAREEMLNAGALAVFTKPVPVADFLDAVERGLGLVPTIFPPEQTSDLKTEARRVRLSDLLTNFRQDYNAQAVFLISDRGRVQARAGSLTNNSMEVSLISALTAIHLASVKASQINRQRTLDSYHVFRSGDNDLIFIAVDSMYSLLVAGNSLVAEDRILDSMKGVIALRGEVEKTLRSIGATGELRAISPNTMSLPRAPEPPKVEDKQEEVAETPPSPEMVAILKAASGKTEPPKAVDDFWEQAAEQHAKKPSSPRVMSLEEARKRGLLSDDEGKR